VFCQNSFKKDKICDVCKKGKQTKERDFNSKTLELIHMDLFGPLRTKSLGDNYYALVVVDDYSNTHKLYSMLLKVMYLNFFENFPNLPKI